MDYWGACCPLADIDVERIDWVQGDKRSRWLETTPLRRVYFITPRPSMPPGTAIAVGQKPGNGTTDYAWFVWLKGYDALADACRQQGC